MPEETPVAIFWDIDKLPLPSESPTYETVLKIIDKAHGYGPVTLFKAYSDAPALVNGESARCDLLAAGVSFVNCKQVESNSNTISVDMLVYAMDHPTPATLVVISDDNLLIYACSMLRMRKYRIVVVSPSNASHHMQGESSAFVDWTGLVEAGDDGQEYDPRSVESLECGLPAAIPPAAPPETPPSAPPAAVPAPAPPAAPPAAPPGANVARPNSQNWGAPVDQESPGTIGVPAHDLPVWSFPNDSDVMTPSSENGSRLPSSLRATSAAPRDRSLFQGLIHELKQHGSHPDRSAVAIALLAGDPSAYARAGVVSFKRFAAKAVAAGVVTLGKSKNGAGRVINTIYLSPAWEHSTSVSTGKTLEAQPSAQELSPAIAEFRCLIEVLQQERESCLDSAHVATWLMEHFPREFCKGGVIGESFGGFNNYVERAKKAGVVTVSKGNVQGGTWVQSISLNPTWRLAGASINTPMSTTVHSTGPPSVPESFSPLVERLREMRDNNIARPYRRTVHAALITENPLIYSTVGLGDFREFGEYAKDAERAGIVALGGEGEREWITLAVNYCNFQI
ncbi:hypothetical protein FIBSPDRAFT_924738 [Athelia psychrophila]|uniref:NYN domain-containing protein n=1 Tax=Athelia psychrophila TaxID=1759441 RepID=A0A166VZ84_9AGAM|nr:hypothetical protein FIBSPDRAFT_924738 [Fibularhizoctonia sp. CBS 109695]